MKVDTPRPIRSSRGDFEPFEVWRKPNGGEALVHRERAQRDPFRPWIWRAPVLRGYRGSPTYPPELVVCDMCVLGRLARDLRNVRQFTHEHRRCGFLHTDANHVTDWNRALIEDQSSTPPQTQGSTK